MSRQQPAGTSSNPTLSHRAEIFRAKLIDNFQLLETISEQGRRRAPVYCSSDVLGMCAVVVVVVFTICIYTTWHLFFKLPLRNMHDVLSLGLGICNSCSIMYHIIPSNIHDAIMLCRSLAIGGSTGGVSRADSETKGIQETATSHQQTHRQETD